MRQKERQKRDNIGDHRHNLDVVLLHRMKKDEGGKKKCMRQDDGEEAKLAGSYAQVVKVDSKKPTAIEFQKAMRSCWQINTSWPCLEVI